MWGEVKNLAWLEKTETLNWGIENRFGFQKFKS